MIEIGQEVVVVRNITNHGFEIGEVVRVVGLDDDGTIRKAETLDGTDYWFLDDMEVAEMKKTEESQ